MTVPDPHQSQKADPDRDWNWSGNQSDKTDAILDSGGWDAMARAHAWYDDGADDHDPPQQKTAYKLPHHLSDGERDDVYEHLAEHYRQFDEEPPDRE